MAKQASRLREAADLMEEGVNQWPALQDGYGYLILLWRKGLMM